MRQAELAHKTASNTRIAERTSKVFFNIEFTPRSLFDFNELKPL